MNKKEQAEMQRMKEQLALRWPCYEMPVRQEWPKNGKMVTGWFQYNCNTEFRVSEGCSNGIFHNSSRTDRTNAQTGGVFYATRLDALKVARCQMSQRFAEALAGIDAQIEAEIAAKETPHD